MQTLKAVSDRVPKKQKKRAKNLITTEKQHLTKKNLCKNWMPSNIIEYRRSSTFQKTLKKKMKKKTMMEMNFHLRSSFLLVSSYIAKQTRVLTSPFYLCDSRLRKRRNLCPKKVDLRTVTAPPSSSSSSPSSYIFLLICAKKGYEGVESERRNPFCRWLGRWRT